MYTVVIRPIVTYAATVWWPRVKFKISQAELSKLQRMAFLGITGAIRTTQWLQLKPSLDSPHYTCRWKQGPRQEITDYVAIINGNPNLKVLDIHT
jgi:hypothetical protein